AAETHRAAVDRDLATLRPRDPEEHLGDLRSSGAEQAEEAEDLTLAEVEADVPDEAGGGQAAYAHQRRADRRRLLREEFSRLGADHCPDRLFRRQLARRRGEHAPARAKHGDLVAEAQYLLDEMADEEDRHALRQQPA